MIIEGKKLEEDAAAMRAAIVLKNYCENQEDCSTCIFGYSNSGCLCMVNDKIPRDYEPNENYLRYNKKLKYNSNYLFYN